MCTYQGFEFHGGYLDSVCVDGRLLDADNCDGDGNLYDMEENIPCPMCRPRHAIKYWAESNGYGGMARKDAIAAAKSLVKDIRKNRGVLALYGKRESVHGYY